MVCNGVLPQRLDGSELENPGENGMITGSRLISGNLHMIGEFLLCCDTIIGSDWYVYLYHIGDTLLLLLLLVVLVFLLLLLLLVCCGHQTWIAGYSLINMEVYSWEDDGTK